MSNFDKPVLAGGIVGALIVYLIFSDNDFGLLLFQLVLSFGVAWAWKRFLGGVK